MVTTVVDQRSEEIPMSVQAGDTPVVSSIVVQAGFACPW
jgi:hypothetical protein